jgi:hypothetical protein
MDGSDFEIIQRKQDVPFRVRHLHQGYVAFHAADLAIYFDRNVVADVRECAHHALPREAGGLLAGRLLRDDEGHYVVVTGMAAAQPTAGGFGTFNLSPAQTEDLRRLLSERYPSADVVGWWHSHSAPSRFSSTDQGNQAIWTHPHHIGLLVFATGAPWACLYAGPESLGPFWPDGPGRVDAARRSEKADLGGDRSAKDNSDRVSAPPSARLTSRRPTDGGRVLRRLIPTALIALLALLAGLLLSKLSASSPSVQNLDVSWSCHADSGNATCHAKCQVPVQWYLDGQLERSGPNVSFPLNKAESVRVEVLGRYGHYSEQQRLTPGNSSRGQKAGAERKMAQT